jgi:hypothetical protein
VELLAVFFPHMSGLRITNVSDTGMSVRVQAETSTVAARCPACSTPSRRVHSRYERRLLDTAIAGRETVVRLRVRRFFCTLEFLCDGRYGWAVACEQEFGPGEHPVAIVHEWNSIAHLQSYEGDPDERPFTRDELQRFLDYADDQVDRAVRAKRKGALAAYRDATLFKVMYG